ncbi:Uncharacterized protein containing caspase domain [Burkholderia pseudomallei]|uniref:caspase family protein n=1 Tax=Burkholderia pseudomallei TaxID=28450 RepID=UPI000F09247F|nr:caspase family protein [Burkholderia pseudomallei]CAJ3151418.1 Uncharacterized protein containing caspase domain [Burkholderia pseudomallei]VCN38213.1 Uncharacterized protein containing caspase domain [Burkholderia pseudomallei]VCN49567.1 Uncharacterized protein containing caspase domain [Burkholderia pseudomallei]VCN64680.1 Uncharacterized protein containing caspase domain [Burkholderia pseudomallei]VCN69613.1 Uncharacterized protein containing caspase domain [Burkholderia pseudomallei]
MTLLTPEDERTKVGVHALLIGVGRYPHLKDGRSRTKFDHAGDIGQLTSPYHSVKAFSDWLRDEINLPGAPLRSLRVLASSPVKGVATHGWIDPEIKNIRKAAAGWYADCDRHSDNVALFYFCGHGVVLGNITALLAQDFGKEELSPFLGSFDPAALADACMAAKATRQLFLIDACRSTPPELRSRFKSPSIPEMLTPRTHSNQGSHQQAELFASQLGTNAYGIDDKPSVFMSSLLASMKGAGAHQNSDGDWVVGTASLRTGLDWLVSRDYEEKVQRVAFGKMSVDFDLHAILGNPSVPVTVRTKPLARLAELQLQTDCPQYRTHPSAKPWQINVEAGKRTFFAGDAANPKQFSHIEDIVPQYRVVSIRCGDDQ